MYVQVLSEDCYLDRKNEIPAGKKPWFVLPVFTQHKVSSVCKRLCGDPWASGNVCHHAAICDACVHACIDLLHQLPCIVHQARQECQQLKASHAGCPGLML